MTLGLGLDGKDVGGGDIVAVIADKSFARITDGNVIENLAGANGALTRAQIPVIRFNGPGDPRWQGPRQKAVIVITGYSDEELSRFVHALGEAGYIEDNYVVFESCETPLSRELMTYIVARYKASAVWSTQGKIFPRDVKTFVETCIRILRENGGRFNLYQLLHDSSRAVGLNGIWSVCGVFRPMWLMAAGASDPNTPRVN